MSAHEVKCAKCKIPLQGPTNPKPQDRFSCPKCGIGDSFDNVMREVGDQAREHVANLTAKMLRDATRGSKHLKFTEKPRAKSARRFIVDLRA